MQTHVFTGRNTQQKTIKQLVIHLNSTSNQEGAVRVVGQFMIGGLPLHCSHIPGMILHPMKSNF